jgi:hypothetical protein
MVPLSQVPDPALPEPDAGASPGSLPPDAPLPLLGCPLFGGLPGWPLLGGGVVVWPPPAWLPPDWFPWYGPPLGFVALPELQLGSPRQGSPPGAAS